MNREELVDLIESAERYGLRHAEVLSMYTVDEIDREFNGVGPDRWPAELRDILSWLLQDVQEAILVHDMDYCMGGTESEYHESNEVLGWNVRRLARKKYGWWRPRRWFLVKLSYKMAELTDRYGWEGWNKA